jgi:hypothetical protein
VEEQEALTRLTPERLIEYDGPKIGRHLRRELKQQAALLYEKVMILRFVSPDFERELEQLGALEFLDRYSERLRQEQEQTRKRTIEYLESLRAERLHNQTKAKEGSPSE